MKKMILTLCALAIIASSFFLSSCKKDKTTPPEITNIEATNHDNGTDSIARGGTISINFDAIAKNDGKLDYYHIEIHDHPASGLVADEYRIIDQSFKDKATFKGLKNAHVHEHITVPANANIGRYHVVITVVDEYGNSVDTENGDTEIKIYQ